VSEGDPEYGAAVAQVIGDRVREPGWSQRELAERSHVLVLSGLRSDLAAVIDHARDDL
jgi:hypothetical protein